MSIADVVAGRGPAGGTPWHIEHADVRDGLTRIPDGSVQCVVTSPPYLGLRDYGVAGQIGLEATPAEYVATLVDVFRGVRRVLRDDGIVWLNLGDTYVNNPGWNAPGPANAGPGNDRHDKPPKRVPFGLPQKNLIGVPWRVAFALQDDGWYLRCDVVWSKPSPMPESVTDRPTRSHEYVFLLTKKARYFYDAEAIAEPVAESSVERLNQPNVALQAGSLRANGGTKTNGPMHAVGGTMTRNKRSVWTINPQPFPSAHFATYPPALVEPCVKAGSRPGDIVLDPFSGAGTTVLVANRLNRRAIGIELNPEYAALARTRITGDAPLFNTEGVA